jgi:hypothetical protein
MDSLPRGNQLEVLEVSRDKISVGKLGFMKGSFFYGISGWWVWNMFLFVHSVGNVIIPTDEVIFFRGVGQPPTR